MLIGAARAEDQCRGGTVNNSRVLHQAAGADGDRTAAGEACCSLDNERPGQPDGHIVSHRVNALNGDIGADTAAWRCVSRTPACAIPDLPRRRNAPVAIGGTAVIATG